MTTDPAENRRPGPIPRRRTIAAAAWLAMAGLAIGWFACPAAAGLGPMNVMVVVNSTSDGSKRVANEYVRLRGVPASNVVYLDYAGPKDHLGGAEFREQILRPVLTEIDARGLSLQVDAIAYSTDFPWRIDFRKEIKDDAAAGPFSPTTPIASLTGATYLYGLTLAKSPALVSLNNNFYVPAVAAGGENLRQCRKVTGAASRGFRSRYAWRPDGTRAADLKSGARYLISTCLGVTDGRGNTVAEVIECLRRAVEADTTPPDGTFCFVRKPGDPRSTTREGCFEGAAAELRGLGAKARVESGTTPAGPIEVAGLMASSAIVSIDPALVRIQPGAICEHLTSSGADFAKTASQTPISDLIRAGATGSSGAVVEPLAIQAKFPLPSMHVHYRRGCSLGEAFYQSAAAPYQLLVIGDPLCQPWAKRPGLAVDGWPGADPLTIRAGEFSSFGLAELGLAPPKGGAEPDAAAKGPATSTDGSPPGAAAALRITPRVTASAGAGVAFWELFIDGRLRMRLPSGAGIAFTAKDLGPGWHDLACVGINPDPIEGQRVQAGSIEVLETPEGRIEPVRLSLPSRPAKHRGGLAVSVAAPGSTRVSVRHNGREVGVVQGASGDVDLDTAVLGRGPVRLQALAEPSGAVSPPVWAQID